MDIHVQQEGIVKKPIDQVWELFRPFGADIMKWWSIYDYVELESPGKDEVGAVRRFKTHGRTYQERLIARDDDRHLEQYEFMSVSPKAPGIRNIVTTITMEPVNDGTKVTWGSVSEIAWFLALPTYFIQNRAYKSAITDLARYFKH